MLFSENSLFCIMSTRHQSLIQSNENEWKKEEEQICRIYLTCFNEALVHQILVVLLKCTAEVAIKFFNTRRGLMWDKLTVGWRSSLHFMRHLRWAVCWCFFQLNSSSASSIYFQNGWFLFHFRNCCIISVRSSYGYVCFLSVTNIQLKC